VAAVEVIVGVHRGAGLLVVQRRESSFQSMPARSRSKRVAPSMLTPVAAASLRSGRISTEKCVYVSVTVGAPDMDGSGSVGPTLRKLS